MSVSIEVEPTKDKQLIASVFLNPTIYAAMSDDSCPKDGHVLLGAIMAIEGIFLKVTRGTELCGVFWFRGAPPSLEVHTALLPSCRGSDAIMAARKAAEWVFGQTDATEITSYAWSDLPAVRWFCRALGMTQTKTEAWKETRNGQRVDITHFSLKKGEENKCQQSP